MGTHSGRQGAQPGRLECSTVAWARLGSEGVASSVSTFQPLQSLGESGIGPHCDSFVNDHVFSALKCLFLGCHCGRTIAWLVVGTHVEELGHAQLPSTVSWGSPLLKLRLNCLCASDAILAGAFKGTCSSGSRPSQGCCWRTWGGKTCLGIQMVPKLERRGPSVTCRSRWPWTLRNSAYLLFSHPETKGS